MPVCLLGAYIGRSHDASLFFGNEIMVLCYSDCGNYNPLVGGMLWRWLNPAFVLLKKGN